MLDILSAYDTKYGGYLMSNIFLPDVEAVSWSFSVRRFWLILLSKDVTIVTPTASVGGVSVT